jgi:hypothetical protein
MSKKTPVRKNTRRNIYQVVNPDGKVVGYRFSSKEATKLADKKEVGGHYQYRVIRKKIQ